MQDVLSVLPHKVKIIEFFPDKKVVLDLYTLAAYFIVKHTRGNGGEGKPQKDKRDNRSHKVIILKDEKDNNLNSACD